MFDDIPASDCPPGEYIVVKPQQIEILSMKQRRKKIFEARVLRWKANSLAGKMTKDKVKFPMTLCHILFIVLSASGGCTRLISNIITRNGI